MKPRILRNQKEKQQPIALLLFLFLASLNVGCAHQVVVDSEPTGARIFIDDKDMGIAPIVYDETSGWEEVHDIKAEKAGHRRAHILVKQTEWNNGVVLGSLFAFLGCAWTGVGLFSLAGLTFARQMPDHVVVVLSPLEKRKKRKKAVEAEILPQLQENRPFSEPKSAPDE